MAFNLFSNLLGLVGAVTGGALGFYTFGWVLNQGYYGPMIPGAFLGLGSGLLARHASIARGVFCGIAAVCLGLYTESSYRPFLKDDSFSYFISNIFNLRPVTLVMIAVGGLIAFWVGKDSGAGWFGKRGLES